jgi:hypothetical protein
MAHVRCQYCKTAGHEIDNCQAPDAATGLVKTSRSRYYNMTSEWIGKPWLYTARWTKSKEDEEEESDQPYQVIITGIDTKPGTRQNNQVTFLSVKLMPMHSNPIMRMVWVKFRRKLRMIFRLHSQSSFSRRYENASANYQNITYRSNQRIQITVGGLLFRTLKITT